MTSSATTAEIAQRLLSLEHAALTRWCNGDPSGFLELSAEDVAYFDPFLDRRLDGLAALTDYYEALRGKIRAERFEILQPRAQLAALGVAVLTFNFVSFGGDGSELRWNCTEVYRHDEPDWKIIQTHWSFTKPKV